MNVVLRPSLPEDIDWLVELRADVLRTDLQRLGRYDEHRVRDRMRQGFRSEWTRVIVEGNGNIGSISTRPEGSVRWIEHFYLERGRQGAGIGGNVLRSVLAEPWGGATRLNVLQGSPARRLYERHGFVTDIEDDVDVFMTLSPSR